MKYAEKDVLRRFGNNLVGVIPWGTHLCQFYESKQDLIDILVPYFAEGLRSNEFCMWITSPPLEVDEATEALKEAVPDLEEYIRNGQIEILSYNDWYLLDGKFDSERVLQGWVEKEKAALKRGFEGLRLTGNTLWVERDLWKSFVDYEEAINSVIGDYRMIAVCTYCLTSCSGMDVVDVVRNHVGTLIKRGDEWYLVEDAARRKAANSALRLSEQKYSALFENMQDGFAYHKVLFDEAGRPVDYVFLEVNDAFERLTGLKRENIVGKRVTEVLPGIENDTANWISVYGRVALTGEPVRFENYSESLHRWYLVSAHSPEKGYFVATFEDVTERKKSEEALANERSLLRGIMENAEVMLAYFDPKFNFVAVNSAYAESSGRKVEELIGKNHFVLFPNEENKAIFEKVRDTGEAETFFDKPFEFADQPERGITYWDWTLAPVKDKAGRVHGLILSLFETTQRKKAEMKIKRQSMIQRGANRILGEALSARTEEALGEVCVAVAEEITDSKFGFIGELDEDGLENISISNPGWDACIMYNQRGHRRPPSNFEVHGIYGRVLLDGEGLFTNDPANHPDSIGLPRGHPPLKSFLGVPLKNNGKTIGIIAVANREGGYSQDELEALEALAPAVVEAFMRKRAEQKIINLSKFPSENPNIILRVDNNGTIMYLNPAGHFLLAEWKTTVGDRAPEKMVRLVAEALASEKKIRFEDSYDGRTFMFTLAPIPKEGYVNFYGIDITERKKTEDAIRRLNERFEMAQHAAGVGVWDWNLRTGNIEWTPEMFLLFGLDPQKDTASFESWNAVLHPEDREKTSAKINEALEKHSFLDDESRIVRPDGQLIWINALGKGIYDDQNKPTRMMGICIDITERKNAEELLREQSLIISYVSDAVFSTDESFIIKTWNLAAERIFGWKAEEVIEKTTISIFDPVYPTLNGTTREQVIKELMNNGFWRGEIIYHKKGGSSIPVSVSASLVKDKNGKVTEVVAIVHDITARKMREKALKEARHDLVRAQAVAKTGSWRLDTQRNVLRWSDENYRMFGIPKGTSLTYETFLDAVHPDDRKYVDQKWKAALQGEPYDVEHRIIADGKVKWMREKAELEFDKDGTLLGGFGTTQDITDVVEMREKLSFYSKHLEELVEEKTKQLKDAEKLITIGQTAGMVGHDIRNPLQSIDGAIYLAKEELQSLNCESHEKTELLEILNIIEDQTHYIDHIVADLQDFARTPIPQLRETNIQELIMESVSTVKVPKNIEVRTIFQEDFENLTVDPLFIKRVTTNLIVNAVQAMPNGGELTIKVSCNEEAAWISIEDTGVGIAEEHKPKIFTPLFTTKAKGQGFGLAVCKKLVEAQGGEISFESEEGKGSKFMIKLPFTRETD